MTNDLLIKHMEERMEKIEAKVDKLLDKFDEFKTDLPKTFVSKDEFNAYKEGVKNEKDAKKGTSSIWQMVIMLIVAVSGWIIKIISDLSNK